MKRAVFFDRDGVLNKPFLKEGKSYPPQTLEEFVFMPYAKEATLLLKEAGYLLIVVTNQPDVGRGRQKQEVVEAMHQHLFSHLPLDALYVCYDEHDPHYKPSPGMLLRAASQYNVILSQSFMIGDRWRDIEASKAAGCISIFLDHGYSEKLLSLPHYTCRNLLESAYYILTSGETC